MIAMQYKISLPSDYDMGKIRRRIKENGCRTDGFPGLLFKAYLVAEKGVHGSLHSEYAPLYFWKDEKGMNEFIFHGFYDNILDSFGWQKIHTGIPFRYEDGGNFVRSAYVLEYEREIPESEKMQDPEYSLDLPGATAKAVTYDPGQWKCTEFYFLETIPEQVSGARIYQVLHISRQKCL